MIRLGHLLIGDFFELDGEIYKAGHANGLEGVRCTNVKTHKVTLIHIDTLVNPMNAKSDKEEHNER